MQYDANGMRTKLGAQGGTSPITYVYNGGQLTRITSNGYSLDFTYGADGRPLTVTYDGTVYYYVTNIQGDVIEIRNEAGNTQVTYAYDAWGNTLTASGYYVLELLNPLRYRGYVYDVLTETYYLQTRYYNPKTGRFLNADGYASTGQGFIGNNMFAYCNNNPVNYIDPTGCYYVRKDDELVKERLCGGNRPAPKPYITNQHTAGVGDQSLGITNVSHGGCGVVATYNAINHLGETVEFERVLEYYNKNWFTSLFLGGLAGILPGAIEQYFKDKGYTVIATSNSAGINHFSKTADACIIYYSWPTPTSWTPYNAHYIFYRRVDNKYEFYNYYSDTAVFSNPVDFVVNDGAFYYIGIFIYD